MTRERVEEWWTNRCNFYEGQIAGELMSIQREIRELEKRVYWNSPEGKARTAKAVAEMRSEFAPTLSALRTLIKLMK